MQARKRARYTPVTNILNRLRARRVARRTYRRPLTRRTTTRSTAGYWKRSYYNCLKQSKPKSAGATYTPFLVKLGNTTELVMRVIPKRNYVAVALTNATDDVISYKLFHIRSISAARAYSRGVSHKVFGSSSNTAEELNNFGQQLSTAGNVVPIATADA